MKILLLSSFALFFMSCQPIQGTLSSHFMETAYEITDSPVFCSKDSDFYESKVLFIVDQTRSNKKSDPQKVMRRQGIQSFIDQNKNNSHVSYGIVGFSDEVFSPITLSGNEVSKDILTFTFDSKLFEKSLTETLSRKDKGRGNYTNLLHTLLNEVAEGIDFDSQINKAKIVDYHIVFISDGNLSVRKDGHKSFVNGVRDMVRRFERVNVHSVYYGDYKNRGLSTAQRAKRGLKAVFQLYAFSSIGFLPVSYNSGPAVSSVDETDDVRHLMQISETGQGSYIDQNEDSEWSLDLSQQWRASPFIVYNLNAGFCLDGRVGLDSDMDGLCDEDEMKMTGFEPDNRFSFNDGYGDYFHWMEFEKQRISLTPCSNRSDEDHDFLTYCEEEYINSLAGGDYPLLSPNNPDSDGDRILDGIEVLVYWANDPLAARNPYNLDNSSEGLSDYERIVQHISPFAPAEEQTAYNTSLAPVKGSQGSCYSLRQTKLPIYPTLFVDEDDTLSQIPQNSGDNTLLIYTLKQKQNSLSRVYQFMYKNVYRVDEKLNLPAEGQSFQYLAFTDSPEN